MDECFDITRKQTFVIKAILLWTMHDYPRYGIVFSLQTQGFFGCPICGPNHENSYSAKELDKIIYHEYRSFLSEGHPWRSNKATNSFNIEMEASSKPP